MGINRYLRFINFKINHCAFTLTELMMVVLVLGTITALAIPQYNNVMERNYCHTMQMNLVAIHSGARIYNIKRRTYVIPSGGNNITDINTDLGLAISIEPPPPNPPRFNYTYVGGVANFTATGTRNGGPVYNCTVTSQNPLGPAPANPNCIGADANNCQPIPSL